MISGIADWLLDPSGPTPLGFCLHWEPGPVWTHTASNIAIGLAYFSIPVVLLRFVRRRRDLAFKPVFALFAAFILLCGAGHWADLATLWWPLYRVEGAVKAATALVSVATAAALWPLLPRALALPSPAQMREANATLARVADERGAALEDLRERKAQWREMFVCAPAVMHSLDAEGRFMTVSERWTEFTGYSRQEAVGRHFTEFLTEAGEAVFRDAWPRFLASGRIDDVQTQLVKRSGEVADVLVSARAFRDAGGRFVRTMGVVTDITGRLRAEERLRHAQKMEAVGQLTGGVAHDFNNVLQAVTGNLELIRRRARGGGGRPEDVARLAGNALDAAKKAAGLTAQLLAFARRQRLDPKPLDPVEVVEGMRALLARTAGERIAFRVQAEAGAGFCLADRNQLESALLNLAINARDAIGGAAAGGAAQGSITVSIRPERVAGAAEGGWPPDGEYLRVAVRDDGPGMPEEVKRRACEPFFTTKAPGKGTGLGLAQIHGFANQSGGTVLIDSAPGRGTEVAILLPRTGAAAAAPAAAGTGEAVEADVEAGHGEIVLLVEDDALVRGALAGTLRDLRYRAVEAADADAALALLDGGAEVDAILSDVTMPGSMDGVGFAAAARARRPGVPVVLATGHAGALDGRSLPPGVGVLRKPLGRAAIAAALRRALAGTRELADA